MEEEEKEEEKEWEEKEEKKEGEEKEDLSNVDNDNDFRGRLQFSYLCSTLAKTASATSHPSGSLCLDTTFTKSKRHTGGLFVSGHNLHQK